jgi:hypothetical protein
MKALLGIIIFIAAAGALLFLFSLFVFDLLSKVFPKASKSVTKKVDKIRDDLDQDISDLLK